MSTHRRASSSDKGPSPRQEGSLNSTAKPAPKSILKKSAKRVTVQAPRDDYADSSSDESIDSRHGSLPGKPTFSKEAKAELVSILRGLWMGLSDASSWPRSLIIVYGSQSIRRSVFKSIALNGGLFIGSVLFYNRYLAPDPAVAPDAAAGSEYMTYFLQTVRWMFAFLWLYPLYCACFFLSEIWYQQIALRLHQLRASINRTGDSTAAPAATATKPASYYNLLRNMAGNIYRALTFLTYLIATHLAGRIPFVGSALSILFVAWIYAYYAFEYRWINLGWPIDKRMRFLEQRWAYFMGFGLPMATISSLLFAGMISMGVCATVFPMYVIMAELAKPPALDQGSRRRKQRWILRYLLPRRVPIFLPAKIINSAILLLFRPSNKPRQQPQQPRQPQQSIPEPQNTS